MAYILEFSQCAHWTSKIGNIRACLNIGESASLKSVHTSRHSRPPTPLIVVVVGGVGGRLADG